MKLQDFGFTRPAPIMKGSLKKNPRVRIHTSRSQTVRENKNMENLQRKEMPKHDFTQYIGQKSRIATVEKHKGQYGSFIKIETEPVGEFETKEGLKPVVASMVLGLQTDDEGNDYVGIGSKADAFLNDYGVQNFSEVVGRSVTVNGRKDKNGVTWLSFV